MRIAVVGCGYWGSKHVRVLCGMNSVSHVYVVDERRELVDSLLIDFPSATGHTSLDEVLDETEAVVIATPPEAHAALASQAMEAGKHVLVEKPLAAKRSEAEEMVRLAAERDVTLAVGHTFVHNAAVWKLQELVSSGELGAIHYLDAARLNLGLYRQDVNVLWDLAAHDISISNYVLDAWPTSVAAWGSRHTNSFAEDVAAIRMTYGDGGIESTVRVSWLDPMKVRRTTIVGSEKMAVYNDLEADERVKVFDRGREQDAQQPVTDAFSVSYRYGEIRVPYIDFREPLRVQAEDFIDAIQTGRPPTATGASGLAVVAVLEASSRSLAENGAPVPVEFSGVARELVA